MSDVEDQLCSSFSFRQKALLFHLHAWFLCLVWWCCCHRLTETSRHKRKFIFIILLLRLIGLTVCEKINTRVRLLQMFISFKQYPYKSCGYIEIHNYSINVDSNKKCAIRCQSKWDHYLLWFKFINWTQSTQSWVVPTPIVKTQYESVAQKTDKHGLYEIMMLIWFVWCDQPANFWLFIEKQETQVQKYPITQ